jgi:hypothetical protein
MVISGGEGKRGAEQFDADPDVSEPPAGVFGHGRDPSTGSHMEAPRLVEPVLEFHVEDLGPVVVGLTGGAVAVPGKKKSQVP